VKRCRSCSGASSESSSTFGGRLLHSRLSQTQAYLFVLSFFRSGIKLLISAVDAI
jgi:hypothetical protein